MRKHLFSKTSCYFVEIKSDKMQHSQNGTRVLIEIEKLSKATSRRFSFGYTRKKYIFFFDWLISPNQEEKLITEQWADNWWKVSSAILSNKMNEGTSKNKHLTIWTTAGKKFTSEFYFFVQHLPLILTNARKYKKKYRKPREGFRSNFSSTRPHSVPFSWKYNSGKAFSISH